MWLSMDTKKIHKNTITGQQGINLIEKRVLEMGFLWYPTGGIEAGIDGTIEIRESATGRAFNAIIQVQSKATIGQFQAETPEGDEISRMISIAYCRKSF